MIQLNLLPDVKLVYIKSQRNKRMALSIATVLTAGLVGITLLLALHVYINQAIHTSGLQSDIDKNITTFKSINDLDTILTVNNQIAALPTLHDGKPAATRLPEILVKIVPEEVKLSELVINFDVFLLRMSGKGISTKDVNVFADVLKNTFYTTVGEGELPVKAFSGVEFEIGVEADDGVGFTAEMAFSSEMFDATNNVDITVPKIISTQSSIRTDLSELFELPTDKETE